MTGSGVTLVVRRRIRARPERLFAAWTRPSQLLDWWGPDGVDCVDPEVDLRVGGRYRIGNRFPDGNVVWIAGEFIAVEPPHLLRYTWRLEGAGGDAAEEVTVRFEPHGDATEVIVAHERIANEAIRDRHREGWEGCLDGLEKVVSTGVTRP